jgi:Ca2+-binding RTX toxin-like protein
VLQHIDGRLIGGEGDDVLVGDRGLGGGGNDVLMVRSGAGDSGDDVLRCFPRDTPCHLDGGPGDDLLTGGASRDRLFGRRGNDVLRGGAGPDDLRGGSGTDRLVSREDRSAGERPKSDQVDCGTGRRDRAVADRRDDVERCERVHLPPATGRAAAAAP